MGGANASVRVGRDVYVAPTAYVGGEVTIGDQVTIMHHVTIRGDVAPIRIGARVNIQDGCVLHTDTGVPLDIANDVAIGHRAVVHGRSVGSGTLIGIGALILQGAEIGPNCIIAPGAVVPPDARVKPGSVMMGVPARFIRSMTDADFSRINHILAAYIQLGRRHAAGEFPPFGGV